MRIPLKANQHRYVCGCRDVLDPKDLLHGLDGPIALDDSRCNGSCKDDVATPCAHEIVEQEPDHCIKCGEAAAAKATGVAPLAWGDAAEIRGRAREALESGQVEVEPVMDRSTAEARVASGDADTWGERAPERYMFLGRLAHGPRHYVTFRFEDRELAASVALLRTHNDHP